MAFENVTNETGPLSISTLALLLTTTEALIVVVSITGNSLIIAVVVKNANMRTTMNLFVVNMASSDLLYSLLIPVNMAIILLGRWPFHVDSLVGLVLCKMLVTSSFLSPGVSVGNLVGITLERYRAVFFPTKRPLLTRRPFMTLTIIWVLYSALVSPVLVVTRLLGKEDAVVCLLVKENGFCEILFSIFTIFYTGLAAIAILVIYPAILIRLWKRTLPGNPSTANQEIRDRTNRKVTYMAVTLMLAFVVSCFPYLGITIRGFIARHDMVQSSRELLLYYIPLVFATTSCAWNPVICILFNSNFRKGFREIIRTCFSCCCRINSNSFNKICIWNLTAHVIEPAVELSDV